MDAQAGREPPSTATVIACCPAVPHNHVTVVTGMSPAMGTYCLSLVLEDITRTDSGLVRSTWG